MAKVIAKISFAGIVTMGAGETKEIEDKSVVKDLVDAGYVEIVPAGKKKGKVAPVQQEDNL